MSLSATSGAVGSSTTASGSGYAASTTTTYSICFSLYSSNVCYGFSSSFAATSSTGALGASGTGVPFTIPQVAPSLYWIQIVSGSTIVTQAAFTVSPINEVLTPSFGPEETSIGVAANNLTPNAFYDVCFSTSTGNCNGGSGWTSTPVFAQATGAGALTATVMAPDQAIQGSYNVNVFPDGFPSNVLATAPFLVTPEALSLSVTSGNVGSSTTGMGSGYAPSTVGVYSICPSLYSSNACYGFSSTPIATSSTGALGASGTGVSFTIPQVAPSLYWIQIVLGSTVIAQAGFTVNPMNEVLTPTFGPEGTSIGVSANDLTPSQSYHLCFSTTASNCSSSTGWSSTPVLAIATAGGVIASAVTVPPQTTQGTYYVNLYQTSPSSVLATAPFLVTPESILATPNTGTSGTSVSVTGGGFAPSTSSTYSICLSTYSSNACYTFPSSFVATSSTGELGASGTGVTFSVPTASPNGLYFIQIVSGGAIIAQAGFGYGQAGPPTLTLSPSSGNVGSSLTATGSGYTASTTTTYAICFSQYPGNVCYNFGSTSTAIATSSTGALGASGTGVSFTIPQTPTGTYYIQIVQGSTIVSQTAYGVDPGETVNPNVGSEGTVVAVGASNLTPNAFYDVCFTTYSGNCNGGTGWSSTSVIAQASGGGVLSTSVTVPAQVMQGTYSINVFPDGFPSNVLVTIPFLVTPETISLSPTFGNIGSTVAVTGTGYAANTVGTYSICFTQYPGNVCYNFGSTQKSVATDGSGGFSSTLTVPPTFSGLYYIQVVSGGAILAQAGFAVNPMSETLTPNIGPEGTSIGVSTTNLTPGQAYHVCFSSSAGNCNGGGGWSSTPILAIASGGGTIAATVHVPEQVVQGTYAVNTYPGNSPSNVLATASFHATPETLSLSPNGGGIGSTVAVTGTGYAANTVGTYSICFTQYPGNVCYNFGSTQKSVATDGSGGFSSTLTVPSNAFGTIYVEVISNGVIISQAVFQVAISISLNPNTGTPGTILTVAGSGFAPGSGITIKYDGGVQTTTPPTVTSDSNGAFSASFTVPAGSPGSHTVMATDTSSNSASATFTLATITTTTTTATSTVTGPTTTVTTTTTSPASTTTQTVTSTETSTVTGPTTTVTSTTTTTLPASTTTQTVTSTDTSTVTGPTTTVTTTATSTLPPSTTTVTSTVTGPTTTVTGPTTTVTSTTTLPASTTTQTVTSTETSTVTGPTTTVTTTLPATTTTETSTVTGPTTTVTSTATLPASTTTVTSTSTVTGPTTTITGPTTTVTTTLPPITTTQTLTSTETSTVTGPTTTVTTTLPPITTTQTLTSTETTTLTTPTTVTTTMTTPTTTTQTTTETTTVTTPTTSTVTTTVTSPTTTTETATVTSTVTSPTTSTVTSTVTSTSTETATTTLTSSTTATSTVTSHTTTTETSTVTTPTTTTETTTITSPTTTTQTVTSTATSTQTLTSTSISTVTTPTTTTVTNTVTSATTTTATSTETSTQTSTVTTPSTTTVTTTQTTPTTTTLTTTQTTTFTSPTTSTTTTTLTSTSTVTSQTTSTVTATTTVVSPTTTTVTVTTITTVTSTVSTTLGPPLLPSITSLACDPSQVQVGHQANCKAVVTGGTSAPTGTVAFISSGTGSFGSVSCGASGNDDNAKAVGGNDKGKGNSMTCSVKYTPAQAGPQTITCTYSGDTTYSGSAGTYLLNAVNREGDHAVGLAVKQADQNLDVLQATYGIAAGAGVREGLPAS